jgi:hypothetical protein
VANGSSQLNGSGPTRGIVTASRAVASPTQSYRWGFLPEPHLSLRAVSSSSWVCAGSGSGSPRASWCDNYAMTMHRPMQLYFCVCNSLQSGFLSEGSSRILLLFYGGFVGGGFLEIVPNFYLFLRAEMDVPCADPTRLFLDLIFLPVARTTVVVAQCQYSVEDPAVPNCCLSFIGPPSGWLAPLILLYSLHSRLARRCCRFRCIAANTPYIQVERMDFQAKL